MSTVFDQILTALVDAFEGIDGTGSFTVDLSEGGRVHVGERDIVQPLPQVQLILDTDGASRPGATLNKTTETVRIGFVGAVGAPSSTERSRATAAAQLLSDMKRAIRDDVHLGGALGVEWCHIPAYQILSAGLDEAPSVGVVQGVIEVRYQLERGI